MKTKDIWNTVGLAIGVIGVFIYAQYEFDDFSVSLILSVSTLTILLRVLPWSYHSWLSIDKLDDSQNKHKSKSVKITGNSSSGNEFNTIVEHAAKPKEVEQYFNFKVNKKETENYLIDLTNNLLSSIFPSLATAAAAIFIGYINNKTQHTIDPAKLMYAFIPVSWQLAYLISPFFHVKKRNEKTLIV